MGVIPSANLRVESVEAEGGMQVALVKASTSFRMKKRGKVPPRLETLSVVSLVWTVEDEGDGGERRYSSEGGSQEERA